MKNIHFQKCNDKVQDDEKCKKAGNNSNYCVFLKATTGNSFNQPCSSCWRLGKVENEITLAKMNIFSPRCPPRFRKLKQQNAEYFQRSGEKRVTEHTNTVLDPDYLDAMVMINMMTGFINFGSRFKRCFVESTECDWAS